MASPGELVRKVAEVLGVPEPTVVVHDRNLATAGLRTKGGRGRSAAKMTPGDAANLILAVAGSSMAKDTVETVNDYAVLPLRGGDVDIRRDRTRYKIDVNSEPAWRLSDFPIPALQALQKDHTFRDALVALIESATDGSLQEAVKNLPPFSEEHRIFGFWDIKVELLGPYPQAVIRIYCHNFGETHYYSMIPEGMDELMKWAEDFSQHGEGDLKQVRVFSAKTILTIGELLKS